VEVGQVPVVDVVEKVELVEEVVDEMVGVIEEADFGTTQEYAEDSLEGFPEH